MKKKSILYLEVKLEVFFFFFQNKWTLNIHIINNMILVIKLCMIELSVINLDLIRGIKGVTCSHFTLQTLIMVFSTLIRNYDN